MIKIKETKSVKMWYDEELGYIFLNVDGGLVENQISIPINKLFQVQRGITSAIQRFYGKKKTNG